MIGHELPLPAILTVLAVVGACVGRFLNICIQRFPRHELLSDQLKAVTRPQTVCRNCSARPTLTERLPVIGWFLAGRRCKSCNGLLSSEFPIIEVLTAILFVLMYWFEIPTGRDAVIADSGLTSREGPPGPEVVTTLYAPIVWLHLRYALHMLMICSLIVATGIDRKVRIIPDGSTIPAMLAALILSGILGQMFIVPIWFQDASTVRILEPIMPSLLKPLFVPWDATGFVQAYPHLHGLLVSAMGAVVGAGSIWLVRQIGFLVLKQEAMGFGDVVLMGMIGSVIGWQPVLAVFIFAPMLAIFAAIINWVANRDNEIPYGPFLSAATVVLLLTWSKSWPFAKRFFDMGPFLIVMVLFMIVLLAASLQLVHMLKQLLGFGSDDQPNGEGGWSSADHLSYFSGERPDEQTGQWQIDQWPGSRSGRGLKQLHDWKHSRFNRDGC